MNDKIYKPYLDGLRGISILLVVIAHGGLGHIVPGGLGVTIFFFISGYLITALLLKEKFNDGSINLLNFYMRRLWRLLPAMAVYIVLAIVIVYFLNKVIDWKEPFSAVLYLSNYYIIFKGYNYIGSAYSPFSILWSLAVEEHFYLFFAPLVALLRSKRSMLIAIFSLLIVPVIIRLLVTLTSSIEFSSEYTYRASDARIDSIAYGCLLAVLNIKNKSKDKFNLKIAISLGIIIFSLVFRDEFFRQVFRYSLQGIALFFIFKELIFSEKLNFARKILSFPLLVFIGKLSYSMYLYHWLALIMIVTFYGGISLSPAWQGIYWISSFAFASLSYYAIERPTLKLRVKYGSNAH